MLGGHASPRYFIAQRWICALDTREAAQRSAGLSARLSGLVNSVLARVAQGQNPLSHTCFPVKSAFQVLTSQVGTALLVNVFGRHRLANDYFQRNGGPRVG